MAIQDFRGTSFSVGRPPYAMPPYQYRGNEMFTLQVETDAGYLRSLVPEPMVNEGTGAVKILDDGWTVVTQDAKPSAHFEHTVLITDGEPELLTYRPREATAEILGIL